MPQTKRKKPSRTAVKHGDLAKQLSAVKAEVNVLRNRCDNVSRALVRLCCPKEWFNDQIDDAEILSRMVEVSSFEAWIGRLSAR
jgi:hypothetical protein